MFCVASDCVSSVFEKDYASSLRALKEEFGRQTFTDELDVSKIHRLDILTLDHFLHTQFDRLTLWLEADDVSRDKRYRYQDNPNFADATSCLPHLLNRRQYETFLMSSRSYRIITQIWNSPIPHASRCMPPHLLSRCAYVGSSWLYGWYYGSSR